jgi:DNA-binding transcriptional LysR family regulator
MNLRDLQYLVAVADHRHFGRAAEACFVSQPTLSTQLKKLEAELGVELVERTPRQVMLTAAGEQVVARARTILGRGRRDPRHRPARPGPAGRHAAPGRVPDDRALPAPARGPGLRRIPARPRAAPRRGEDRRAAGAAALRRLDAAVLALPVDDEAPAGAAALPRGLRARRAGHSPLAAGGAGHAVIGYADGCDRLEVAGRRAGAAARRRALPARPGPGGLPARRGRRARRLPGDQPGDPAAHGRRRGRGDPAAGARREPTRCRSLPRSRCGASAPPPRIATSRWSGGARASSTTCWREVARLR